MIRLLLSLTLSIIASITVAWLVMVVFFPHTGLDSAIGVILLAALSGLSLGAGAWWMAERQR
jgi:hypothetical protein